MWLDGVYMAGPFLAEFAAQFDTPELFDDLAQEIFLIEKHMRDPQTGLLYHGWDESHQQRWANSQRPVARRTSGRGRSGGMPWRS